jgi:Golgi nucleoside diphosphatase
VFTTAPPPLTIPTDKEKYTDRISPGMSDFVDDFDGLQKYFAKLIDFAKTTLIDDQQYWSEYPFYLRATGGMRAVPYQKREDMMAFTRQLFSNKTFCPFFFQFDFARVMAGEEEAVYSWATANYLFGTLLHNMPGIGPVISPINRTYGIVDLGGASAQISFFVPSQDISEGLFKLQIGSQRHWNVYSKSFLSYGHNSARERHLKSIIQDSSSSSSSQSSSLTTSCFFSGYVEDYLMTEQKKHSIKEKKYKISGPSSSSKHQFDECYELLYPLLKKELNVYCNEVYDNECSMDGFYQPSLPIGDNGHFVASATYKYAWYFLQLPAFGTISSFKDKAKLICAMNYKEIKNYYQSLNSTIKKDELLPYYCFLTSYVAVLLESK